MFTLSFLADVSFHLRLFLIKLVKIQVKSFKYLVNHLSKYYLTVKSSSFYVNSGKFVVNRGKVSSTKAAEIAEEIFPCSTSH